MFFLIIVFILFASILWITVRPSKKPFQLPTYGNALSSRDHLKDLEKAKISSNDLYLSEYLKRDTAISGAMGMSSHSIDFRAPSNIQDLTIQSKLHTILQKAKQTGTEQSFQETQNAIQKIYKNTRINPNQVLTKNQIAAIEAAADGQEIPTVIEGDSLEDNSLSLSEFKQLTPNREQNPRFFNFAKFSIQTKPGSAEKLIEKQYQ